MQAAAFTVAASILHGRQYEHGQYSAVYAVELSYTNNLVRVDEVRAGSELYGSYHGLAGFTNPLGMTKQSIVGLVRAVPVSRPSGDDDGDPYSSGKYISCTNWSKIISNLELFVKCFCKIQLIFKCKKMKLFKIYY